MLCPTKRSLPVGEGTKACEGSSRIEQSMEAHAITAEDVCIATRW